MKRRLGSGWKTYELMSKRTEETPVSEALAKDGVNALPAIKKMLMVQDVGWPGALELHFGAKGKHRIVKKDDVIWLLKCTPNCWRLYFYVYKAQKWIIYVHAVCKKQNEEDSNDTKEARNGYDDIARGTSGITEFVFPLG
jgi:hypothetical protein